MLVPPCHVCMRVPYNLQFIPTCLKSSFVISILRILGVSNTPTVNGRIVCDMYNVGYFVLEFVNYYSGLTSLLEKCFFSGFLLFVWKCFKTCFGSQ